MQNKTVPLAVKLKGTAAPKVEPSPILERKLKRFRAFCPFDETHNPDTGFKTYGSKDSAAVEAGRHIRAEHKDALYTEVTVLRRRKIAEEQFEVIG